MTAADQLRQQGEERGIIKGQREMLIRLMEARFGPLPEEIAARVHAAVPDVIERAALRILTATSPVDVLSDG